MYSKTRSLPPRITRIAGHFEATFLPYSDPQNAVALRGAKGVLAAVRDVQEAVLILVLLVDGRHERGGGWQDVATHKDEDRLLRTELDALADDVHELAHREVGGYQVLLLVNLRNLALLRLLADDLVR